MTIDTEHFRALLLDARGRVAGAVDYMHAEAAPSPDDEGELPNETNLADQATDLLDFENLPGPRGLPLLLPAPPGAGSPPPSS